VPGEPLLPAAPPCARRVRRPPPDAARCPWTAADAILATYHDAHYGVPITDDAGLLERLSLEIMQAGLSWLTILKKQDSFTRAFGGFHVARVATYGESDITRLLGDAGIVRNRMKIESIIHNAGVFQRLASEHGSVSAWLAHFDNGEPQAKAIWVKRFKKTFRFTGGEITGEFLMSIGYLPITHDAACWLARTS
jgi:DNA-3-methyladenine glycosylase I